MTKRKLARQIKIEFVKDGGNPNDVRFCSEDKLIQWFNTCCECKEPRQILNEEELNHAIGVSNDIEHFVDVTNRFLYLRSVESKN